MEIIKIKKNQPITHAKFHMGSDVEIKVFCTLAFALTGDKEAVFCSQPQFSVGTLATKNNPYKIYKGLDLPGLYSNTNNTIETNSILYEDTPGIPKYSTSKTTFEYNDKGFPTKEIAESYTVGYKYE